MQGNGDDSTESAIGAPSPEHAGTASEYGTALSELRMWSGLTYRQLEGKAAALGHSLPASTIATALGRATLPRESFVAAFTLACGLDAEESRRWLDTRRRIAMGKPVTAPPVEEPPDGDESDRPSRWRRAATLLAALVVGIAGTLGVQSLSSGESPTATPASVASPAMPIPELGIPAVGSWAWLHPAGAPKELCITEGVDRSEHYRSAIAALRQCAEAAPPRTFVEPIGDGSMQFQWQHPVLGIGCLTVLTAGDGRGLVEPRDKCEDANPAQLFRLDLDGASAPNRVRIRVNVTDLCLSLRDKTPAAGTEIVLQHCSDAAEQEFVFELVPPP